MLQLLCSGSRLRLWILGLLWTSLDEEDLQYDHAEKLLEKFPRTAGHGNHGRVVHSKVGGCAAEQIAGASKLPSLTTRAKGQMQHSTTSIQSSKDATWMVY